MKERLTRIAIIVGLILLIPLYGNFFVEGWNWGFFDFVFMGLLLFVTGLGIDFVSKKFTNPIYRLLAICTVIFGFLLVWGAMVANLGEKLLEKIICGGVC